MRVLRQAPNQPVAVHKQVAVLYAGTQKAFVKVPDSRLHDAMKALYEAIETKESGQAYTARFEAKPAMDDELKGMLNALIEETVKKFRKS